MVAAEVKSGQLVRRIKGDSKLLGLILSVNQEEKTAEVLLSDAGKEKTLTCGFDELNLRNVTDNFINQVKALNA